MDHVDRLRKSPQTRIEIPLETQAWALDSQAPPPTTGLKKFNRGSVWVVVNMISLIGLLMTT